MNKREGVDITFDNLYKCNYWIGNYFKEGKIYIPIEKIHGAAIVDEFGEIYYRVHCGKWEKIPLNTRLGKLLYGKLK